MNTKELERFMAHIDQRESGCWLSTYSTRNGYARMGVSRDGVLSTPMTHRLAYEHFIGPVPVGFDLDHLCRNRACANPTHLEPVTRLENVRRGLMVALITPEVREVFAASKRGKARPWRPEWRAKLVTAHRARAEAMTHCKHGHLYDEANTVTDRHGSRSCAECRRQAATRCYRRKTGRAA